MVLALAASSGAASGSNTLGYSVKVDSHSPGLSTTCISKSIALLFLICNVVILKIILNFHNMVFWFFTFLTINWGISIAATLFDSIRTFLISSTIPMATGSINGDIGLGGEVGGVLTGLTEGDLTTGTMTGGSANRSSRGRFNW